MMHKSKAIRIISLAELFKIKKKRLIKTGSEKDSNDLASIKLYMRD